uniref:Chromosome 3 open reading frame 52 n=1 Tax=Mustela putorius furo TaxID=9669 RepID=M3XMP8_MUSPF
FSGGHHHKHEGENVDQALLCGPGERWLPLRQSLPLAPPPANYPSVFQEKEESPWSSCNKKLIGECKLWMVIASVFLGLIIVIIISLCLIGVTYIDEDENEILELSSNKTFLVVLKIPEECAAEEEWPHLLMERTWSAVHVSPSLWSWTFSAADSVPFSGENATVAFHLQFGVPSEDDGFMKYRMNKELVRGVLLQNLHDQGVSGCETLGLDPASFLLYG